MPLHVIVHCETLLQLWWWFPMLANAILRPTHRPLASEDDREAQSASEAPYEAQAPYDDAYAAADSANDMAQYAQLKADISRTSRRFAFFLSGYLALVSTFDVSWTSSVSVQMM